MNSLGAVLVIDNDPSIQCLLSAVIRRNQLTATVACDGNVALELLALHDYDVIVLDLSMPPVNGFELLRHIACLRPELLERTIIVTAADEATYRDCAYVREVWALLRKPVDLAELDEQILSCFAERALTKQRRPGRHALPRVTPRLLARSVS